MSPSQIKLELDLNSTPEAVQDASSGEIDQQVEQIYADTRAAVCSYILCFGIPFAEAQDLTQEVYLRLYRTMGKGESIRNVRAWIFRVAHNLALKSRAREKVFRLATPDWERLAASSGSPEGLLLEREKMSRLAMALQQLSPQQRNCLYLRAEGLRYREIAEVLNIKSSTVGEFLTRATRSIAEAVHD